MSPDYRDQTERLVVEGTAVLLRDVPEPLQDEVVSRMRVFLNGVDRVPNEEFSGATFDEFRDKFQRVCEAIRDEFCNDPECNISPDEHPDVVQSSCGKQQSHCIQAQSDSCAAARAKRCI